MYYIAPPRNGKRLGGWCLVLLWYYAFMKEQKREKEIIKYKVFTLRLHEETKKKLIHQRERSGLSWNRFIIKLLK